MGRRADRGGLCHMDGGVVRSSGEHFFGLGNGDLPAEFCNRVNEIAERHGATFSNPNLPDGARYWFACPNRGNPFDNATVDAVWSDLIAEGLADDNGLIVPEESEDE